jgi:hypothetical protein
VLAKKMNGGDSQAQVNFEMKMASLIQTTLYLE